jgi:hypothetical protein
MNVIPPESATTSPLNNVNLATVVSEQFQYYVTQCAEIVCGNDR